MSRLNLALLAIVIACALGLITAQHQARKLFVELEAGLTAAKKFDDGAASTPLILSEQPRTATSFVILLTLPPKSNE